MLKKKCLEIPQKCKFYRNLLLVNIVLKYLMFELYHLITYIKLIMVYDK